MVSNTGMHDMEEIRLLSLPPPLYSTPPPPYYNLLMEDSIPSVTRLCSFIMGDVIRTMLDRLGVPYLWESAAETSPTLHNLPNDQLVLTDAVALPGELHDALRSSPAHTMNISVHNWRRWMRDPSSAGTFEGILVQNIHHLKRRVQHFQHEYLLVELAPSGGNGPVHIVIERTLNKADTTTSLMGPAMDVISILSAANLTLYLNATLLQRQSWSMTTVPQPRLTELIEITFSLSSYRPDYDPRTFNCYYYCVVILQVMERYRTQRLSPHITHGTWRFKEARFLLCRLLDTGVTMADASEIIAQFYRGARPLLPITGDVTQTWVQNIEGRLQSVEDRMNQLMAG